jgi:hypothetical protein
VLPFLFFALKVFLYPPSGAYEGYNAFQGLRPFFPSVAATAGTFAFFLAQQRLLAAIVFLPLGLWLLRRSAILPAGTTDGRRLLVLGAAAIFLAAFPYWVLGLVPTFQLWASRHELLLPLGAALLIAGIFTRAAAASGLVARLRPWLLGMLVSLCIADGLLFYGWAAADWMKQKEVVRQLAAHPELQGAPLIVFDDRTEALNATGRAYRPYEWNGMMLAAYRDADERRFGVSAGQYEQYLQGDFQKFLGLYRASAHRAGAAAQPAYVTITSSARGRPAWLGPLQFLPPRLQLQVGRGGAIDGRIASTDEEGSRK